MQINEVFDELFDDYTAKIISWVPYYKEMLGAIVQLPEGFRAKRILDLGCGNGNATQLLLKAFPDAHFTLVDASEEMISGCQQRFSAETNLHYQQSFFEDLNFSPGRYDLVVATLALHHLPAEGKQSIFPKIYSWLPSDGLFSYSDLMVDRQSPEHKSHMQKWKNFVLKNDAGDDWPWLMDHYNTYDFPDGREATIGWLKESGFEKVDIPFRVDHWTNLLVSK